MEPLYFDEDCDDNDKSGLFRQYSEYIVVIANCQAGSRLDHDRIKVSLRDA